MTPSGRVPFDGTFEELARAPGVRARALRDVYAEGPDVEPDDPVIVHPDEAAVILGAFATGEAAYGHSPPMRARALASRLTDRVEHGTPSPVRR